MSDLNEVSEVHQPRTGAKDMKSRQYPHNTPGTSTRVEDQLYFQGSGACQLISHRKQGSKADAPAQESQVQTNSSLNS